MGKCTHGKFAELTILTEKFPKLPPLGSHSACRERTGGVTTTQVRIPFSTTAPHKITVYTSIADTVHFAFLLLNIIVTLLS